MRAKTAEMQRIEKEHGGEEISAIVRRYVDQHGMGGAADRLLVHRATLSNWCREFGIEIQVRATVKDAEGAAV